MSERVGIAGSSIWPDPAAVVALIQTLPPATTIVTGDRAGVDAIVRDAAAAAGLPVTIHRPDAPRYGGGAEYQRIKAIVADSDRLILFAANDPETQRTTTGTAMTIDLAEAAEKPVKIVTTPVPAVVCQIIARLRARFAAIRSAPTNGHRDARIRSAGAYVQELIVKRETDRAWLAEAWDELDDMPDGDHKTMCEKRWLKRLRTYEIVCDAVADAEAVFTV